MGLILIAIAEMIGAQSGIGYMIWNAWQLMAVDTMFVRPRRDRPPRLSLQLGARRSGTLAPAVEGARLTLPLSRITGEGRASIEARHHLLAQELQRSHHPVVGDLGAAIHLAQDAVEPELFVQLEETVG